MLQDEIAFSTRLISSADEQPRNDVWALVRARTKPRTIRPLVWLHGLMAMNIRKAAAAAVTVAVLLITFYSTSLVNNPTPQPSPKPQAPVIAVNSDDPIGNHTDAVIDYIGDM